MFAESVYAKLRKNLRLKKTQKTKFFPKKQPFSLLPNFPKKKTVFAEFPLFVYKMACESIGLSITTMYPKFS